MGYIVEIVPNAEKEFLKLSQELRKNIRSKIILLKENPLHIERMFTGK